MQTAVAATGVSPLWLATGCSIGTTASSPFTGLESRKYWRDIIDAHEDQYEAVEHEVGFGCRAPRQIFELARRIVLLCWWASAVLAGTAPDEVRDLAAVRGGGREDADMITTLHGMTKTGLERVAHVDADRGQTVCVRISLPRKSRGRYQLNYWTGSGYRVWGVYGGLHAVRAAEELVVARYERRVVEEKKEEKPFVEPKPASVWISASAGLPTLGKKR